MENESKLDPPKIIINNKRKTIIIAVVAVLVIAVWAGYWYWSGSKQGPSSEGAPSLGSQIFDKTQNQLEGQMPDTNPFKDQKNPFDAIYKNPFE